MAAAFTKRLGNFLLSMAKAIHQLPITRSFFYGIQVRTLDVFDNRDFQNFSIREFADKNRNFVELRPLRGSPPTFTSHNLKFATSYLSNNKGLNNSLFAN